MSDHEDEQEYVTNMVEVDLRLALTLLESELKNVKDENRRLKENLQQLCMNECAEAAAQEKKKQLRQPTLLKWKFYHENKEAIRAEKGFTNWRDVKRESDARYAATSQTS